MASLEITAEQFTDVCTHVGNIAIQSAALEQSLDSLIWTLYHRLGGKHHVDKKQPGLPRTASKKIKFLKLCFQHISLLNQFKGDTSAMFGTLTVTFNHRNNIIHGVLSGYHAATTICSFSKLNAVGEYHTQETNDYTLEYMADIAFHLMSIAASVLKLTHAIDQKFMPKYAE